MESSQKFTLAATGDVLLHTRLCRKAKRKIRNGYDFDGLMEETKHLFNKGDLTIVNQESIIGGKELGISDFPKFNSPVDIGYTLKNFGVDIVSLANNHIMDKGEEGVLKSIENWEKIGIPYVGAYKSKEDQETLRIINKNGLRVCFLSYTRKMPSVKLPKDKPYMVDCYEPMKIKKIEKRIRNIRKENLADVIILSLHFGKEYHLYPAMEQKEISATLSDAGADVIIGHHPHVLQPPEYILNSRGKRTFVMNSLGNFFSGQKGLYRQIGAFMTIDIEKFNDNPVLKIDKPTLKLTFTDSTDKKNYKMHLLEDIVEQREYIKTHMGDFRSAEVYEELKTRLSQWVPEIEIS
ncbi:CapA family protein [Thalassobacillus sp. B23F22_16]|uniref:CapA family protein n=1 Tax=Thalassobacillus sp. B23F22_16 TaxID=3459513 RepID=UPI00373F79D0